MTITEQQQLTSGYTQAKLPMRYNFTHFLLYNNLQKHTIHWSGYVPTPYWATLHYFYELVITSVLL